MLFHTVKCEHPLGSNVLQQVLFTMSLLKRLQSGFYYENTWKLLCELKILIHVIDSFINDCEIKIKEAFLQKSF